MSSSFQAPIDAQARDLLLQAGFGGNIQNLQDNRFDGENGRFIQCVSDQTLVALCYHKTKNHAAIVEVHNGFTSLFGAQDKIHRSSRGQAPPGQWACAYTMSGRLGGDKARFEYY